jgi:hypothetical protein
MVDDDQTHFILDEHREPIKAVDALIRLASYREGRPLTGGVG